MSVAIVSSSLMKHNIYHICFRHDNRSVLHIIPSPNKEVYVSIYYPNESARFCSSYVTNRNALSLVLSKAPVGIIVDALLESHRSEWSVLDKSCQQAVDIIMEKLHELAVMDIEYDP